MRITQSMTNRRYMSQLNAALERKNASERKINSTKRYNRASEDPISAAKALRTRVISALFMTAAPWIKTAGYADAADG